MKLKLYLVKNGISVKDFAEKCGCTRTHLSAVINGKLRAGLPLAKLIEILTQGEVKAKDVLALYNKKDGITKDNRIKK